MLIATLGATLTFFGCQKDYTDDINKVREDLTALLEQQKTELTDAINSAKEEAQKYADDAAAKAVADVKAELLEEIASQVDQAIEDAKKYTDGELSKVWDELDAMDETIATLSGRIDAVESDINVLEGKVSDNAKAIEELEKFRTEAEQQLRTLNEFMETAKEDISGLKETAEELQKLIDDLEADVEALQGDITRIDGVLDEYRKELDEIKEDIKEINEKLNVLEGKIGDRLTSISLIPEVYVDGVPAFELPTIIYTPLSVGKDETVAPNRAFEDQAVPRKDAIVRYHLSPAHVTEEGIASAEYLIESAKMVTKAAWDNDIIDIRGYEVNSDNELEVTVRRLNGVSFYAQDVNDSQNYEFYTAALSLGIADELLMEGETEANVVSEYSAIYEAPYEIHIAPLKDQSREIVEYTCAKFDTVYTEAMAKTNNVAAMVDFDNELDLLTMVTSCAHELGIKTGGVEVDKEEMADLGLGFRFAIPTEPYEVGAEKTDQQAFIRFKEGSETVVVSTVPGDYLDNEASVGRTPIVRVELIDLNNGEKIVDVQYIKIRWVKQAIPATDLGELPVDFTYILGCTGFEGSLNWKEINQYVLARLGRNDAGEVTGISHKEFEDYYHQADDENIIWEAVDNAFEETDADITFNWDINPNTNPTTSVLTWKMTVDQVGNVIDQIIKNGSVQKQIKVTINPTAGQEDYAGAITFTLTLNIIVKDLPTIYGYAEQFWSETGKLAQIQPIGFSDKSNTQPGVLDFVRYNYNILDLFHYLPAYDAPEDFWYGNAGKGVTNFMYNIDPTDEQIAAYAAEGYDLVDHWACRMWDIQFSADQEIGYAPLFAAGQKYDPNNDGKLGYSLVRKGQLDYSSQIVPNEMGLNWYSFIGQDISEINFTLADDNNGDFEGAVGLLNPSSVTDDARKDVAVDVWTRINAHNYYKATTFDVWYVEPVTLPLPTITGKLEDINMNPSTVTVQSEFNSNSNLKDFQGQAINSDDKLAYYGIYGPVWDKTGADNILVDITEIVTEDGYTNITVNPDLNPNNPEDIAKMRTASECNFMVEWDGNKLTVTNQTGHELTKTCHLWVKAEYGHAYGHFVVWIPVEYVPNTSK